MMGDRSMASEREEFTSRPDLVLLPAMLCDGDLYRPQIEALSDLVQPFPRVVAELSMADAARLLLRDAPSRFLLAGMSYGGCLAIEVAITAPQRVAGLWLMGCNPGPHGDREGALRSVDRVRAGAFDAVVDETATTIVYGDGPNAASAVSAFGSMARRAGPEIFLRQSVSLIERLDRRPALSRISCPTLLLWGKEDRFAGLQHAKYMEEHIPGSRLVVLESCGHLPTLEQPDDTTDAARRWLREILLAAG
jgi:pimeloyl-ACP methyl ester carboxylesterase